MVDFVLAMFIFLFGISTGCYLRDGQEDHKREAPMGAKFHYGLALALTFCSVVLAAMLAGG